MKVKKKILLLCLLVFTAFGINSQNHKGKLLFTDGTSLEGFGELTKKGKIKFRISLDDEPDIWDDTIVSGVVFYNLDFDVEFEYVTIRNDSSPKLMRVIRKGEVTLYGEDVEVITNFNFDPNTPVDNNYGTIPRSEINYFLKRKDENFVLTFNWKTEKKMKELFGNDCEVINDIIKTKEFRRLSREGIVNLYNVFCVE